MDKILSAEEFFFNYSVDDEYDNLSPNCKQEIVYKAIALTKLHVEAFVDEVKENIEWEPHIGSVITEKKIDQLLTKFKEKL